MRSNPFDQNDHVLVVGNFDPAPQSLELSELGNRGHFNYCRVRDLYSGESPSLLDGRLSIPPCSFYWLTDRQP
jgi:amylosucrase